MKQHNNHLHALVLLCLVLYSSIGVYAQTLVQPLSRSQGRFSNKDVGIVLVLDLRQEQLTIPGYEFLGPVPGYMYGTKNQALYGYWFVTNADYTAKDSSKINLKFMSDAAADPQQLRLTFKNDSTIECKLEGGIEMRRQVGNTRKLEKINGVFELVRE